MSDEPLSDDELPDPDDIPEKFKGPEGHDEKDVPEDA